jgi:hypothetical protein
LTNKDICHEQEGNTLGSDSQSFGIQV